MLFRKKKERPFVTAIIPAAGSSQRMGGVNKLMMDLEGVPVLGRTLLALEACSAIQEIIVAAGEEHVVTYAELGAALGITKLSKVVKGGASRQESVYKAALEASSKANYLAVHDGARPLVTEEIIKSACEAAFLYNASAAGVKVHDTIKEIADNERISRTVDRDVLRAMQTPQVAEKALLLAALQSAIEADAPITDECSALERMGIRPVVTLGSYENIKITTAVDLLFAKAVLEGRENR